MSFSILVARNVGDGVWHVESSDVPGLNAEAEKLGALIDIIRDLAPELLQANGVVSASTPVELLIQHHLHAGVERAA